MGASITHVASKDNHAQKFLAKAKTHPTLLKGSNYMKDLQ